MLFKKLRKKLKGKETDVLYNIYNSQSPKKALLSYITHPFRQESSQHRLTHTNYFEATTIAKILDELGYSVDVINYDKRISNIQLYDVIIGFGEPFQQYFQESTRKSKLIYYGTGMHVSHQNHATLGRVKDVYNKKGVWLIQSSRYVDKTWTFQTFLCDAILALGNEQCANTYQRYYDGKIYEIPAPTYLCQDAKEIIEIRQHNPNSNTHFLWFGSAGLVHKGLDLLLEYFSVHPNLTLHVCGHIENEPKFCSAFHSELYETDNIILHGFVDISSSQFKEILSNCDFVIFPSCSEGGAPSVLNVIGNGGLIPIITKETSISYENGILIKDFNYLSIDNAINIALKMDKSEILESQYKNLEFVLNNNSQNNYYHTMKRAIADIIDS